MGTNKYFTYCVKCNERTSCDINGEPSRCLECKETTGAPKEADALNAEKDYIAEEIIDRGSKLHHKLFGKKEQK